MEERLERGKIYCVGNACEGNYSQFVLSRPQGSARIAKRLMHECSKELNKLRKEKGQHVLVTSAKQEEKFLFIFSPARISENSEAIGARVLQNEKEKADVVCTNGCRRQTQV